MPATKKPRKTEQTLLDLLGQTPLWIRQDLWMAFTSTDKRRPYRFYDMRRDEAVMLRAAPEPATLGAGTPAQMIAIEPIPEKEQKAWAEAFVKGIADAELRGDLTRLLLKDRWYTGFKERLSGDQAQRAAWATLRSHKVFEVVASWIKTNGLTVNPLVPKSNSAAHQRGTAGSQTDEQALRKRLVRAIERMPYHELVTLRLPVGYLLD